MLFVATAVSLYVFSGVALKQNVEWSTEWVSEGRRGCNDGLHILSFAMYCSDGNEATGTVVNDENNFFKRVRFLFRGREE